MVSSARMLFRIRVLLIGVIVGLVLSGVTAFPLVLEMRWLARVMGASPKGSAAEYSDVLTWVVRVRDGLEETGLRYPFLAYGTDWLAFAHLVIAAAFVGPLKDPVRNRFVIGWGIFCCAGVIPLALIAGPVRGIPWFHQLVDCAFGIIALPPLWLCWQWSGEIEKRGAEQTP